MATPESQELRTDQKAVKRQTATGVGWVLPMTRLYFMRARPHKRRSGRLANPRIFNTLGSCDDIVWI